MSAQGTVALGVLVVLYTRNAMCFSACSVGQRSRNSIAKDTVSKALFTELK